MHACFVPNAEMPAKANALLKVQSRTVPLVDATFKAIDAAPARMLTALLRCQINVSFHT